jgi:hypothetical protein
VRNAFCHDCATPSKYAQRVLRRLKAAAAGAEQIDVTVYTDGNLPPASRVGTAARTLLLSKLRPRPRRVTVHVRHGSTRRLLVTLRGRRAGHPPAI